MQNHDIFHTNSQNGRNKSSLLSRFNKSRGSCKPMNSKMMIIDDSIIETSVGVPYSSYSNTINTGRSHFNQERGSVGTQPSSFQQNTQYQNRYNNLYNNSIKDKEHLNEILNIKIPNLNSKIVKTPRNKIEYSNFSELSHRNQSAQRSGNNFSRFFSIRDKNEKINRFDAFQHGQNIEQISFAPKDSILSQRHPQGFLVEKLAQEKPKTSQYQSRPRYRKQSIQGSKASNWERTKPNAGILLQQLQNMHEVTERRYMQNERQSKQIEEIKQLSKLDKSKRLQVIRHTYANCPTDQFQDGQSTEFDFSQLKNSQRSQSKTPQASSRYNVPSCQVNINIDPIDITDYNIRAQKKALVSKFYKHSNAQNNSILPNKEAEIDLDLIDLNPNKSSEIKDENLQISNPLQKIKAKALWKVVGLSIPKQAEQKKLENQIENPRAKYLFNSNPKKIIQMLDQKIDQKILRFKMEIIEDAVKNKIDIDDHQKNVLQFVQKRLKYHFRDRCDTFLEPLITNKNNCCLHNLDGYKNIDFDNGLKRDLGPIELEENQGKNMSCTHTQTNDKNLRQVLYEQYKQIEKFKKESRAHLGRHISKKEAVQLFIEEMYNMDNLTEEEMSLFKDQESIEKMMLGPLAILVKSEIKEELANQKEEGLAPIESLLIDNQDKSLFYYDTTPHVITEQKEADLEVNRAPTLAELSSSEVTTTVLPPAAKHRYAYTVSNEAKSYLESLMKLLTEQNTETKTEIERKPQIAKFDYLDKYSQIYDHFIKSQIQRIKQISLPTQAVQIHHSKPSITILELLQYVKVLQRKLLPKRTVYDTSDSDEDVQVPALRYPVVVRDVFRRKEKTSANVSQTASEQIKSQEQSLEILHKDLLFKKFNDYIKSCLDGGYDDEQELFSLQTFQLYQSCQELPWPVFNKIQNQKLILDSEYLSPADCGMLGKYIEWTKHNEFTNIRLLEIKNCGLKDSQVADILRGIAGQRQIVSINIFNEKINNKSIKVICELLQRCRPNSLLELQLVGCKWMSHTTVLTLLRQLTNKSMLSKLTLSNFKLLQQDHSEEIDSLLIWYIQNLIDWFQEPPVYETLTHLDLSYLGLKPITFMKILTKLGAHRKLQFLNLAGNQIVNNDLQYEKAICNIIEFNCQNLTHFDLRATGSNLNIPLIFQSIQKFSKSLQVFHVDSKQLTLDEIMDMDIKFNHFLPLTQNIESYKQMKSDNWIQQIGIKHLLQQTNVSDQSKLIDNWLNKELKKQIREKLDTSLYQTQNILEPFLMVRNNDEIEEEIEKVVEVKVQKKQKVVKAVNKKLNKKQLEAILDKEEEGKEQKKFELPKLFYREIDPIGEDNFKHYHLVRDLSNSSYSCTFEDIGDEITQNLNSDTSWKLNDLKCKYCEKRQIVNINISVLESQIPDGYHEIQNTEIIKILKNFFPSNQKLTQPIIFGSLTDWKILTMTPASVYTLNLIKQDVLDHAVYNRKRNYPLITQEKVAQGYKQILTNLSKNKSEIDLQLINNSQIRFRELLQYAKTQIHFEFYRQVHEFGKFEENGKSFDDCYVLQISAKPGKHSIIVFEPKFNKWFCREVLVDTTRGLIPYVPSRVDLNQELNIQKLGKDSIEKEESILNFLNDMAPWRLDSIIQTSLSQGKIEELWSKYDQINATFFKIIQDNVHAKIEAENALEQKEIEMKEQGLEIESKPEKTLIEMIEERQLLVQPPNNEDITLQLSQIATHFERPQPQEEKQVNRQQYFMYILNHIMAGVDIQPYLYIPQHQIKEE